MNLQLSKCWHTDDGKLLFQASAFDHTTATRRRGFLLLDPRADESVRFLYDKPDFILKSVGLAALVRKWIPSGRLSGLSLSNPEAGNEFACLHVETDHELLRGNADIYLFKKPEKTIDLVIHQMSLARITSSGQFTAKKAFPLADYPASRLSDDAFQFWLRQLLEGTGVNPSSDLASDTPPAAFSPARRTARDKITRRLKTLRKTLREVEGNVPGDNEVTALRQQAALLRQNLWRIKPGDFELLIDDPPHPPVTLSLDPDATPGANLERIFVQIKKRERAADIQQRRLDKIKLTIESMEQSLARLRDASTTISDFEVEAILADRGLSAAAGLRGQKAIKSSQSSRKQAPGRLFALPSGAKLRIGRDARESDQVVKGAASNDWWAHIAGGAHGSHVIISGVMVKNTLPDADARVAAILAIHFSDRRNGMEGEVYVARRHQIRKTKGMAPGLWLISKAATRVIRYDQQELARCFAMEIRDGIQREGRELEPTDP